MRTPLIINFTIVALNWSLCPLKRFCSTATVWLSGLVEFDKKTGFLEEFPPPLKDLSTEKWEIDLCSLTEHTDL